MDTNMSERLLAARVRNMRQEAERVLSIELVPADGMHFPSFTPGSHIDVHLDNGMVRSYSLVNAPDEPGRYVIAVLADAQGRGGSAHVHAALRCGAELAISRPRNHFELDESAIHSVLIAGGIGITPILCMYRRLRALGRSVELIYAARSRREAAFLDDLNALAGDVRLHCDAELGGAKLDMGPILASQPEGTHAYCCGPAPMLAAFESACVAACISHVHVERFQAQAESGTAPVVSYQVELARSGRSLKVAAGQSLLDCLLAARVEVDYSCGEGICGACVTRVIDGNVVHCDSVLDEAARRRGDSMMVCVSHGAGGRLVLDL